MKYYVGVDPGLSGAIGVVCDNNGKLSATVFDTPTGIKSSKGRKKKSSNSREFDIAGMVSLLKQFVGKTNKIYLERVHSMPGQGSVSVFGFGEGFGVWKGIIVALGFELELVSPQTWKKEFADKLIQETVEKPEELDITTPQYNRMSIADRKKYDEAETEYNRQKRLTKEKAKDAAMKLAVELFPNLKDEIKLKKHDGRAESVLIAERGRRLQAVPLSSNGDQNGKEKLR